MSIRLACPTCQTALTLPDTSAGKSRLCPKCNLMFRVPVPPTMADKPLPEAQLLDESTPFPEPTDTRPAPRPIYKQHRDTPPPEEMTGEKSERRSGGRRRRRIRAKESKVPPAVLIGGGIAAFVLVASLVYLAYRFTEEPEGPKPVLPIDDPKTAPGEGTTIPAGPTTVDLPKTWSINAPSLGFRAAWPVPPGSLGYTPVESLTVGYSGLKPNAWAYTEMVSRIIMTVSVIDLPDDGTIDADATLDRHVDKLRRKASNGIAITPLTIGGLPYRQIAHVSDGDRSISRVTIKGNRLWTVSVVCPRQVEADDPKVVRFLNFFQPL